MNKHRTIKSLKFWCSASTFQGRHYLSLSSLKTAVERYRCSQQTLTRYIVDWKKAGKIFSAGRSWYSDLGQEFQLETESVCRIAEFLKTQFPLLEFSCWSTKQISEYHQHLPMRFMTFVYVDRYSMTDVAISLKEAFPGVPVIKNPSRHEAESLERQSMNIVIRPILYDDRMEQTLHYLSIEKILVDYAIEAERLILIDGMEYRNVFENVINSARVNISVLMRRISHRKNKNQNIRTILNHLA